MDEKKVLFPEERKAYREFGASNGWVDRFKKVIPITTKCSKDIKEVRSSLEAYFKDLNDTVSRLNHPIIYNMDETCTFFEISRDYT